jgi:hypothetical protein
MSLQEQQNLLAKLYTDADFRLAFLSQPKKKGAAYDLSESEIGEIARIMPEELNFFAESLFWKRLREVEKFLPATKKVLAEDFTGLFRVFSQNFNPQKVKKHFEDAHGFARFLQKQDISNLARSAAKFERAKLEFFGFEKLLVVCRLDCDVRHLLSSDATKPKEINEGRKKIAVWLRTGKRVRHFFI